MQISLISSWFYWFKPWSIEDYSNYITKIDAVIITLDTPDTHKSAQSLSHSCWGLGCCADKDHWTSPGKSCLSVFNFLPFKLNSSNWQYSPSHCTWAPSTLCSELPTPNLALSDRKLNIITACASLTAVFLERNIRLDDLKGLFQPKWFCHSVISWGLLNTWGEAALT